MKVGSREENAQVRARMQGSELNRADVLLAPPNGLSAAKRRGLGVLQPYNSSAVSCEWTCRGSSGTHNDPLDPHVKPSKPRFTCIGWHNAQCRSFLVEG